MVCEFDAIVKAVRISKDEFRDEVIVVFKKDDGTFDACLETEYLGEEDKVYEKYLNGSIVRM